METSLAEYAVTAQNQEEGGAAVVALKDGQDSDGHRRGVGLADVVTHDEHEAHGEGDGGSLALLKEQSQIVSLPLNRFYDTYSEDLSFAQHRL